MTARAARLRRRVGRGSGARVAPLPSAGLRRPDVDQRGQGLVEYGLILAGVALVAIVTLVFFPDQVAAVLDLIGNAIDQATG